MKPILILKTGNTVPGIPPARGDFEHWIRAGMGLPDDDCLVVNVVNGEVLPEPETVAGIVVTGSPAMVTDLLDWSEASATFLRRAAAASIPVLGICYGHQLLAHALGGSVDFHPGGREIGTTAVTLTAAAAGDVLFAGLPPTFAVNVSHKQTVTVLPPDAVVLASNPFEPFHAVRFRERIWGLQFHPEFAADVMHAYLDERAEVLVEEGLDPTALRNGVQQTPIAGSLLRAFAALVRGGQVDRIVLPGVLLQQHHLR